MKKRRRCISFLDTLLSTITMRSLLLYSFLLGVSTIQSSNYTCRETAVNIQLSVAQSNHSAWQPATACARSPCDVISDDETSCRSYSAPCFAYQSPNYGRICAPAFVCSVLEPCNQTTFTCSSNASICVTDSCCSPQAMCLPWTSLKLCLSVNSSIYNGSQ